MLAHGSMLCPAEIGAALSFLTAAPMVWAWLRWRLR
jgi:hypothetical protein